MKIEKAANTEKSAVEMEGAKGVEIRWLISKDDGADNFAMRMFELKPGLLPVDLSEAIAGKTALQAAGHELAIKLIKKIAKEAEDKQLGSPN